jgi:hypothetical protein
MNLQQWQPAQDSPEVPVNENFEALGHVAVYAKDATTTTGLTWGYLGGRWGGFAIAASELALTASSTLYVTVERATGAVSVSSSDAAWSDLDAHARVYKLTTGVSTVLAVEDHRAGRGGVHGYVQAGGAGPAVAPVVAVGTTSHAVTLDDVGGYLRFSATGAKTSSFDVAQGFATSDEVHIANRAASGDVTLTGSGIALAAPKGGTLVLEPGDTVTVKFVSASAADVFGSTKAAP